MTELLFIASLFLSLLVGQFGRIELFGKLVNGYVQDPITFVFVTYLIIRYGTSPIKNVLKNSSVQFLSGSVIFAYLLTFSEYTMVNNIIAFLYCIRISMYLLLGVYLRYLYKKKKDLLQTVHKFTFLFSILLILISVVQYIFYSNFWGLYAFGWDPHLFRMSATFIDVYVAAALYGMLALYWYKKGNLVFAVIFVACLVLTFSRSSYVAFLFSVIIFLILSKKWKHLFIILFTFFVFILLSPKPFGEGVSLLRTASINSRIKDYQMGINMAIKKPLFGYGYNRIRFGKESLNLIKVDDRSHSVSSFHSSFLIIMVTTGIVGLIAFLIFFVKFGLSHKSLFPILFYLSVMSLFDNVLLHVFILLPLIVIGSDES